MLSIMSTLCLDRGFFPEFDAIVTSDDLNIAVKGCRANDVHFLSNLFMNCHEYLRYCSIVTSSYKNIVGEGYSEFNSMAIMWLGAAFIGLICVVLAIILPTQRVPFSGFSFSLLALWFPLIRYLRGKSLPGA